MSEDRWQDLALAVLGETVRPLARERLLLAALGDERFSPTLRAQLQQLFSLTDDELADLVVRINRGGSWRPTRVRGLTVIAVTDAELPRGPVPAGATRLVLRMEPGCSFPRHAHAGDEAMLVLEGGLDTDDGRSARPGESIASNAGSTHGITADPTCASDCVCALLLSDGITLV